MLVFGFEIFVAPGPASESLRRAPFAVAFFGKALISTVLIVIAYGIGGLVLFPDRFVVQTPYLDLARDTGYALSVALVLQFLLLVRRLIGGRVLTNIVLGRYHEPLSEQRIFMFLDVSGSTALAEKVGGVGAYSMISRFFFDVAQETARYGGDTHEYIGDEVVVTWPLEGCRAQKWRPALFSLDPGSSILTEANRPFAKSSHIGTLEERPRHGLRRAMAETARVEVAVIGAGVGNYSPPPIPGKIQGIFAIRSALGSDALL